MNTRKFLLAIILLVWAKSSFSQLGGTHNYLDTTYIAPRNMAQQSEFMNNTHNFPAKPRDMWQLGAFVGFPWVDGDCPTAISGPGSGMTKYAYGGGLSLRKALGYVVSVRASAAYYHMLGLDYQRNRNFNNHPRIQELYGAAPRGYMHNYETKAFLPSLEALISLNNIMFHSRQGRWNLYGTLGYSALFYKTKMDLEDATGVRYPYETVLTTGRSRQDIRNDLRALMDGNYETRALTNDRRPDGPEEYNLRHCFTSGLGFEYRVGRKTSLSAEYKRIATRDDYVDGWFRQSGDLVNEVFTSEWDNIGFVSLGVNFNIGNSKKRIPPLWWMNPLEFAYSELNNPKHMQLPKVKLDDADGDGVTDQFDLEPNTPPGAPVDTHGVAKDTDGDGVPDYRDKELITLQNCFPVNEDGIGNCPEPECCKELRDRVSSGPVSGPCPISDLPSIQFRNNNIRISQDAEAILASVAEQLKANPECRVRVSGHGPVSKAAQQLSWDRVNAVIKYLVERQGIAESRFIFEYGTEGDPNTVDLTPTTDQGPNAVPAPHPNLRRNR
jgi:OOP family OmpA-OmpF porin